jgi:hypothetical protein
MYEIDEHDTVRELTDLPQSSVGAPLPVVLSDEHRLILAYHLEEVPASWDGTTARIIDPTSPGEPIAIVSFEGYAAFTFGPPNDETFHGHPLAARGLRPYASFEVMSSSWLRRLERMNAVHPCHRREVFGQLRHYVFAFHDSTFECLARGFSLATTRGSMDEALSEMRKRLGWHAA